MIAIVTGDLRTVTQAITSVLSTVTHEIHKRKDVYVHYRCDSPVTNNPTLQRSERAGRDEAANQFQALVYKYNFFSRLERDSAELQECGIHSCANDRLTVAK